MKRVTKLSFRALSAAVALLVAVPALAETKIAVVDVAQLLDKSPQSKSVQEKLKGEFAPRQRDLVAQEQAFNAKQEKFSKDAATMTDDQRARADKELRDNKRDLQQKAAEFNDDFTARQNEEMARLQRTLGEEVRTYAKAQNFDLVLVQGVIYASPSLDITPAILSALQARAAKPAAPPAAGPAAAPADSAAKPATK